MATARKVNAPKEKINKGHYLEVSDRCHCLNLMIEELILNHPLVQQNEEMTGWVLEAQAKLSRLYQKVGEKL